MSSEQYVDFTLQDGVAVIALNRGPVNVIDHPMIDAIHAALLRADRDQGARGNPDQCTSWYVLRRHGS